MTVADDVTGPSCVAHHVGDRVIDGELAHEFVERMCCWLIGFHRFSVEGVEGEVG
jgi:hypothetical protein